MSAASESSPTAVESHQNIVLTNECNENDHSVCSDAKDCDDHISCKRIEAMSNACFVQVDVMPEQHTHVCPKKRKLQEWLNKNLRIEMTDGRTLIGVFLCTDRDSNIILGSCSEYLTTPGEDARILGLVMIPGRHIVSIQIEAASIETT